MKVALLGGTGFIGSYVVDRLLAAGHVPRLLVRAGSEGRVARPDLCETVTGQVGERRAVADCLRGCDALIYLIGILREFPHRGVTFRELQTEGLRRSLEAAKDSGARRVVLMSANGVELGGTPYQRTKRAAEELLRDGEFDWTVFRPSVVFGDPRGRTDFCTQLKRQLIDPPLPATVFFPGLAIAQAGRQPMSPVHVEDVAAAFVNALQRAEAFSSTHVLAGPLTLTWSEVIRVIAEASGKPRKLQAPAPAWGVKAVAHVFERFPWFPLTAAQVDMLMQGNAGDGSEIFGLLGIDARPFGVEHLGYLANA